eukprot:c27720_g1_i1 orf=493-2166(-)
MTVKLCLFVTTLVTLALSFESPFAFPLSASSRWIVDEVDGSRVKLGCVNWVGHLEPLFPEGLNEQPLSTITSTIRDLGFNCVRLTWATFMFTNPTLGRRTIRQSCVLLKLQKVLRGIIRHNPDMVDLTVVDAYKTVVSSLGEKGVMVVLDNQVSRPGWCCGESDGNGFWGDKYFDPKVWLNGLQTVASTFRSSAHVVAISLRNELRGPRQKVSDWYHYMNLGAQAVHGANPNILVILSGLNYDTDLHFLLSEQLNTSFRNKLVYEAHWYAFTFGNRFDVGNLNQVCASVKATIMSKTGFITTPNMSFTAPLFISEFGLDQRGLNKGHDRYFSCFSAFAAAGDFDWAYWPLGGSYYLRNGLEEYEEFYGVLNAHWDAPRNTTILARLQALQIPWQPADTTLAQRYQVLFHPASGFCIRKSFRNDLALGSCNETGRWSYTPQGRITLLNTYLCIAAVGDGQLAKLAVVGTEKNGPWEWVSQAKMQLATKDESGNTLCLDGSSPPSLTTQKCLCIDDGSKCDSSKDPSSQWFILITTRTRFRIPAIQSMQQAEDSHIEVE